MADDLFRLVEVWPDAAMNKSDLFAVTKNPDKFPIAILYIVCSVIPIPFMATLIYVMIKDKDLRKNPSYLIMTRLLICDVVQVLGHVLTGCFILFPHLTKVDYLVRLAGCIVTVVWLMSYPLVCELSIYRCLVVTGRTKANHLPQILKVTEGFFWILMAADFVFCWVEKGVKFWEIYWDNDPDRLGGQVANILEVYFGLPALLIGYVIYVCTLGHLIVKKKQFGVGNDAKQEFSLFIQTTCESFYCLLLVTLWHNMDDWWPVMTHWEGWITDLAWIIYFYWKSMLLLLFNKTVRNKWLWYMCCSQEKFALGPPTALKARASMITTVSRMESIPMTSRRMAVVA